MPDPLGRRTAGKKENIVSLKQNSADSYCGDIYIMSARCLFVYPVLLLRLALRPALCFLTVTVLRKILNFQRPYDVYDYVSLCDYHPGKGCSFPSRHTASAAIIALEIFHLWHGIGIIMLFFSPIDRPASYSVRKSFL